MRKVKSMIVYVCFTVILAMSTNVAASIFNTTDTVYAADKKTDKTRNDAKKKKVQQKRERLVKCAMKYKKTRYIWGGTNLNKGVDCSGFSQAIYKKQGYKLPRTASQQARKGKRVSQKNLKKGDLLFYGSGKRISHVAIYIGGGKIIHASNPRDGVKISKYNYRKPVVIKRFIF